MTNTPSIMPILSAGAHDGPEQGACIMEYASFLAGERWTDFPTCTNDALAILAQTANDYPTNEEPRENLLPLLGDLMSTGTPDAEESLRRDLRILVMLARKYDQSPSPLDTFIFISNEDVIAANLAYNKKVSDFLDRVERLIEGPINRNSCARTMNPLDQMVIFDRGRPSGVIAAVLGRIAGGLTVQCLHSLDGIKQDLINVISGYQPGLEFLREALAETMKHIDAEPRTITADDLERCAALTAS